jgi:hypothetical protein
VPGVWHEVVNTARADGRAMRAEAMSLAGHSLVLLRFKEA